MNPDKAATVRRARRAASKPTRHPRLTKPGQLPAPGDPNDEVTALVEALHGTVQRLEELTAGEVDTVADRHGRPFLLRRAQEQFRHSEAAKQVAILNALPAHIALLDTQGVIISVNEAWRRFAGENVLQGPGHGIGLNYLGICDSAQGNDSSEAQQVAKGIRSVLSGGVKNFSIEYPCHSPTEQRWFLMTVTPMAKDRPGGAVVMHLNITQKKQDEEALLRFGSAMDSVADAIYVVDRSSMAFVHVNDAACRMQNKTRAELHALGPAGLLSVSRAELERTYDAIIAGGEDAAPLEMLRERQDGSQAWVEVRRHARRVGKRWAIVTLVRDISERKIIESEIHETRNFLASIFDNIPNSIFVKDARDLKFVRVNTACETLTGYGEKEFMGKSDYDFFPREQADAFVVKDREALAGKQQVFIVEETITSRDGTQKLLQTKKFPILDKDGNPQYLLGMSEDITERKQAERRLRESEAKFRHLIEQADDGMFTSDAQGNFVLVNSRGCELLGYTEDEMIGMNGSLTYPEEDREFHARRLHTVDSGQTLRFERMVKRKDGSTFPAAISIKKIDNGMVQVIFHDITERRSQERKISRLIRIHAVLSGINAAIVRIRDRQELFQEACRIIVEHGHFILGWIAVLDHDSGKLTAVAQSGLDDQPSAGSDLFNGSVGLVPAGAAEVALREKKSAIDNAIEKAPGTILEHEPDTSRVRQVAIALGAKSVIVLPLIVKGQTFGVLTLYAPERNFFDDEEVKLLNDLAGDISFGLEFINKEEEVDYLAYYDALTGLANRRLFLERLAQYMRGALSGGHKLALFFIDLERFRNINDSLGRAAGDALLKQVSDWLAVHVGDPNLLARLGGDHFAIVLPEIKREGNVVTLIEKRVRAFLDHPFRLNETVFRMPIKVGVALFPDDGSDADTLLQNAEAALKKAKASGERYLFYTQKMTDTVAGKLTLENQLRQAVDNEEFVLHYQPKVNLDSGKLTGAEALIRWNDPRTGQVPPARFIPILEESGLIYEVGRWALRKAIEDFLRWHTAGLPAVRIAVNMSPLQLRNRDFVDEIKRATGIDPRAAAGLELEITESLIMEDVKHSIASLQAIRALGVTIAIDDFGTGFSSLSYLSKLPVDTLKIDQSFVHEMTVTQEGLALVSTIISLAHSLKLEVVAEGVETAEQSRLLRLLNCDEMQGYLFSKPVPGEIFEASFLAPPLLGGDKVDAPSQVRKRE